MNREQVIAKLEEIRMVESKKRCRESELHGLQDELEKLLVHEKRVLQGKISALVRKAGGGWRCSKCSMHVQRISDNLNYFGNIVDFRVSVYVQFDFLLDDVRGVVNFNFGLDKLDEMMKAFRIVLGVNG
jgi:hypothetical protein